MNRIGIAISTRNRSHAFCKTIEHVSKYRPDDSALVVVDDASDLLYCYPDYRFEERAGIPKVKNKCLELLMDKGCEHLFLFDDDCFPITDNWHVPYVNSPYKHLCYTFLNHYKVENGHMYHVLGNGCMIYIHRDVVDNIGGFDTAFGLGKYEHAQFSHRAHSSGFCPAPYVDVVGSNKLFHAMDEKGEVQRTMTEREMIIQLNAGRRHFNKTIKDTSLYEYR